MMLQRMQIRTIQIFAEGAKRKTVTADTKSE